MPYRGGSSALSRHISGCLGLAQRPQLPAAHLHLSSLIRRPPQSQHRNLAFTAHKISCCYQDIIAPFLPTASPCCSVSLSAIASNWAPPPPRAHRLLFPGFTSSTAPDRDFAQLLVLPHVLVRSRLRPHSHLDSREIPAACGVAKAASTCRAACCTDSSTASDPLLAWKCDGPPSLRLIRGTHRPRHLSHYLCRSSQARSRMTN